MFNQNKTIKLTKRAILKTKKTKKTEQIMNEIKKDSMTIESICKVLGCESSAFYARHRKNLKPIAKLGRTVLYATDDVKAYCETIAIPNNFNIVESWEK